MKNWQIVLTTVLIGLIAARARAVPPGWPVDTYWQVDTGDWSNGANWNNGEPTGTNYDKAYINNSGTAHITQVGEDCQYLTLGENAGQSGSVELSGAGQLSATWEYIGKGGTGTFIHTGGTNSTRSVYIGTYGASGHGTYELSGDGQLLTTYEHIGWGLNGTGTFTQTGGINSADAVMHLGASAGSNGTYELSGTGQLSVLRQNIGNCGTGSFIQTGGTHTVNMWLSVARWASGHGTYELSGDGQLSAPNEYIGEESTGSFTQTGGTNTVSGSVYLGLDVGSDGIYTISDGSLNTANLYTGYNGNGILTVVGDDSTVSVSNNYTQGSNGTLETKFDTDGISAISVGGSAILDGTWNVVDLGGAPFGTFDILLAGGGISGTFGTVNLPGPDWSWGISASSSDTLWVQHIPEPTTVDV
ncbi:MAG: hypothetical protein KAT11_03840, partial [Phycisphaerae bacterium]|nr:hypothetical protein [Phycisphaerae bacterium]